MLNFLISLFFGFFTATGGDSLPNLPANYDKWPVVMEHTCDKFSLTVYHTMTIEADHLVASYVYDGDLVSYDIQEAGDAGEKYVSYAYADGVWHETDVTEKEGQEKSVRATQVALFLVGGEEALVSFDECRRKAEKELLGEIGTFFDMFSDD